MARIALLLLSAGIELFEAEAELWPDGVEYSLEKPAAEVRLVLAFPAGLGTMGERGTAALASALFVVEYNDADRQTCYWNRYRPLPFDAEANPEWYGDEESPGLFVTEGSTSELTERTLVIRLPRVNRWRVRVTPLYGDTEHVRRGATLVQVAEVRDAKPRAFEELDPFPVAEEAEAPAEAEVTEPPPEEPAPEEEPREEAVAFTSVVSVGGTTVRVIGAGAVPKAHCPCEPPKRRRTAPAGRAQPPTFQPVPVLQPAPPLLPLPQPAPVLQPMPVLQPAPALLPLPRPVAGAPVHGTLPPWGAPLPEDAGGAR